jgi:L-fucose isomerase
MSKNRYIGEFPVIGIRPTIDGRRGALDVRGSLEEQTMNMAKSAAALFEQNLKYVNGDPVKVVIADTTIGRVAEAAACEAKFKKEGVAITLTVTPCWCYGAETMDMKIHSAAELLPDTQKVAHDYALLQAIGIALE